MKKRSVIVDLFEFNDSQGIPFKWEIQGVFISTGFECTDPKVKLGSPSRVDPFLIHPIEVLFKEVQKNSPNTYQSPFSLQIANPFATPGVEDIYFVTVKSDKTERLGSGTVHEDEVIIGGGGDE